MKSKMRPLAVFGWKGEKTTEKVPVGTFHAMSTVTGHLVPIRDGVHVIVHETPRVTTHQPNVVHVDDACWRPARRTDRGVVRTGATRPYHGGRQIRLAVN